MELIEINNYKIFMPESVLILKDTFIQRNPKMHEAGGIILGQISGKNIYVTKISTPCKFDKSSRFTFERNKENAQKIIDIEFKESSGKTIYLGEWHTHPEKTPTPSGQDVKMIKEQFKKNKLNEPFVLLVIFGIKESYLGFYNGQLNGCVKAI